MSIDADARQFVRSRAHFSCEYCGVSEVEAGGELTIDHYHPLTHGGADNLDNLLYCCTRCNQYKADYWPSTDDPALWNPRQEPFHQHFVVLANGDLLSLTTVGELTIKRLRLNRPQLTEHRLRRQRVAEEAQLLARYREIVLLLESVLHQKAELVTEQHRLLEEYRSLLSILLGEE